MISMEIRKDRLPVPGTAIRGTALEINNVFSEKPTFSNLAFRTGKIEEDSDSWVSKIPDEAQIDMSLMRLGKERYDIHCAICHGTYGNGNGVMKEFLGVAPRNLSDPDLTNYLETQDVSQMGKFSILSVWELEICLDLKTNFLLKNVGLSCSMYGRFNLMYLKHNRRPKIN